MGLKRIELKVALIDDDTEMVEASQETTWRGLDKQGVLFVEKHLLMSYFGMNKEAGEFLAAAA